MSQTGYRVHWTHHEGRDHFIGELWPDRPTAEWIADMLRDSGYCLNVKVMRAHA